MKLMRKLGYPVSLLYAAAVYLRNKWYDWGWLPSRVFDVPVLCIGNLSVGGSGKTPMVEWVVRHLSPESNVAVLSRGYRRKSKGFQISGPESTAAQVGDEPLQIARKFPWITVAVDANRSRGIECLMRLKDPDLILLDDGFQHRKVRPGRSILLTAYDELYPDAYYLPTGNLRDHRSQARRADLVVVTKCPAVISPSDREEIRKKLRLQDRQQLAFASLCYQRPTDTMGEEVDWDTLEGEPFTLVTGIANPEPLVRYLEALGLPFEHLRYADHHNFTKGELEKLSERNQILTTEKDSMRLEGHLKNYWILPVSHCFESADQDVMEAFLNQL